MFYAILLLVFGIVCLFAGLFARPATNRALFRFQSGNWSAQRLAKATGIRTESDCANERERMLYRAFIHTNEHCVDFLKLHLDGFKAFFALGVGLVFVGGRILFLALGVRKRLAVTAGAAE